MLGSLDKNKLDKLASKTQMRSYGDGDVIVSQGDTGRSFFIVYQGTVLVRQHYGVGEIQQCFELARLGAGNHFGERSLLKGEPRGADVVAVGCVRCLELGYDVWLQVWPMPISLPVNLTLDLDH